MKKIVKTKIAFSDEEVVSAIQEMLKYNLHLVRMSHSVDEDNSTTYKLRFENKTYGLEVK